MTLTELRSKGRKTRFPLIEVFSAVLLVMGTILFGTELVDYSNSSDSLGADVTIGGVQVGGLAESDRVGRLEAVYLEQPIYLRYNGNPIWLYPSEVGFSLDIDGMQAEATRLGASDDNFWRGFWNYLWRKPQPEINVELIATYSEAELDLYLQDLALRYDAPTVGPGFDPVSATFNTETSNTRLDVDQARPLIAHALMQSDAEKRSIELPTVGVESQSATMDTLRSALIQYLDTNNVLYNSNTMVVSMYVLDLKTGEEMGLQENIQVSAVSTIKVPLMVSYFRHKLTEPSDEEKRFLAEAIICSQNSAANELLHITSLNTGIDSYAEGANLLNQTMCEIGNTNTKLITALFNGSKEELARAGYNGNIYYSPAPSTPCPTGTGPVLDTSVNLSVDAYNKTTAADMGNTLGLIYQCAMTGGGLHTIFSDEITQTECQYMLEILRGTRFERFSELGAPAGTTIHHKVGYYAEWNGDVAIVRSPATDYVFVVYVWEKDLDFNGGSSISTWDIMDDLARVVYNYFNPTAPMAETRTPVNPLGGAACVMPQAADEINLNNIDDNRFDENGNPVSSACYDYPFCRPFDNWGQ